MWKFRFLSFQMFLHLWVNVIFYPPAVSSVPVQLFFFSFCFGRRGSVKVSACTQRLKETRWCWQTSAGPRSTKCRSGRAPWLVTAASALQLSSAPCLMVKCACLRLKKSLTLATPCFVPRNSSLRFLSAYSPCAPFCYEFIGCETMSLCWAFVEQINSCNVPFFLLLLSTNSVNYVLAFFSVCFVS